MTTGEEPGCNLRAPQVESGLIESCSIEIKFLIRLMLRYIVAMLKFVTHYFSGSDVALELFEAPEGQKASKAPRISSRTLKLNPLHSDTVLYLDQSHQEWYMTILLSMWKLECMIWNPGFVPG